jgi:pSer/pThr/pTyr-binding forkhead associated (FHA) protein
MLIIWVHIMKPKLLIDLVLGFSNILPNDNKVRIMGRARDCDIKTSLKDVGGKVSKYHAKIKHEENGTVYLWDNKSKNGTYIERNGELIQIYTKEQIFSGDIIYLGMHYKLELRIEDIVAKTNEENRERLRDTQTDKMTITMP